MRGNVFSNRCPFGHLYSYVGIGRESNGNGGDNHCRTSARLTHELERPRWAFHHLGGDDVGRLQLRPDPPFALDVEHVRQSPHAHTRMDAHVGVKGDDDVVGLVGLAGLGHDSKLITQCRLKYWTARSCRLAAARLENVPRFRRLPVRGSIFLEYRRYFPEGSFRIMSQSSPGRRRSGRRGRWRHRLLLLLGAVDRDQSPNNEEDTESVEDDGDRTKVTAKYRVATHESDRDDDRAPEDALHERVSWFEELPM